MSIASVYQYQVAAGRMQEVMKAAAEAKKLHESLGARVRVWRASFAGPNAGLVSYVSEFDDYRAFQDFIDGLQAHGPGPLAQAMEGGALTMVASSMASELQV